MDNTQTSSFDEQACKVKLQQLIKNNEGRKEPLKGDKMPFSDTWVGLVKLTGITKEAIDYFYDGFKIAGSEPLYRYASDTNVTNAYTTFTKARRSVENERECTMRAMLNLLAVSPK